jgi:hypothetical protein
LSALGVTREDVGERNDQKRLNDGAITTARMFKRAYGSLSSSVVYLKRVDDLVTLLEGIVVRLSKGQ